MTETKKRVSSLAKSYEVSSDLLLRLLKDMGEDVKSASSMIDLPTFQKVKPLVVAEKERMERDELIRSGKKIPMKAVIKKGPPPQPPVHIPAPVAETPAPPPPPEPARPIIEAAPEIAPVAKEAPKAETQAAPPPMEKSEPKAAEAKPVAPEVEPEAKRPAKPALEPDMEMPAARPVPRAAATEEKRPVEAAEKAAPEQKHEAKPDDATDGSGKAPALDPKMTSAEAEAKARSIYQELKVSVEKPDAALLARIARSRQDQGRRGGGGGQQQGYSGQLGRPQGGQGNRGPGGPGGAGGYQGNRGPGGPGGAGGYQGNRGPSGPGGAGGYQGNRGPGGPGGAGGGYQGNRGPGGPGGAGGYQGNRGPGGGGGVGPTRGPRTGERPFDGPRDVFALRAQQAGVVSGLGVGVPPGPGRTDRDKDRDKERDKSGGPPSPTTTRRSGGRGRRKTKEQIEAELLAARNNVTKVMASLSKNPGKLRRDRKEDEGEETGEEKRILKVADFITIGELAGQLNVLPAKVIAKCMEMGMMVTINMRLDHEMIALIAEEFGFTAELMEEYSEEVGVGDSSQDDPDSLQTRAPIITVMGHVDHGKTSILDYIRKTNVIAGESGGITQHIGAYRVETEHGPICFLDTPGHEAFSAMRTRGANVTDVVVLVVAADSMVMPQTKEAISLAKNANCQIVVAINKIDLEAANPDKIKAQLAEAGVQVEQYGGNVPCVEVSAKKGLNMDKLLETLALESEVLDLKANPDRAASGTVIESRLDKGKGPMATVLVQNGTLHVGDAFVTGIYSGRVRALLDERDNPLEWVGPSNPVQILGMEGAPQSGDSFVVVEDEREAREIASRRRLAAKDRELRQKRHITLDQLHEQIKSGEFHDLKCIIKGDVDGSVEAIANSLEKLSTKEVRVNVISKGVGAVKEADIHLAAAADALVIAFHVLPNDHVRALAEREGVSINHYRIIYDVVDDVKAAMEGLLSPEVREEVAGDAEILKLFKIKGTGLVAGCKVGSGMVERELKARVYRNGIEVAEAKVTSLKREKDDVKQVKAGFECGIGLDNVKDIREGDVIAFFRKVEVARKLTPVNA